MKSLLDYLPEGMVDCGSGMKPTPESAPNAGGRSEQAALDQLRKLPQPVSINGGAYSYRCDVTKNPSVWYASDGSDIHPKSLRELGEWFEKWVAQEWDSFLDGYCDVEDLVSMNILRTKVPRDQEEHETMNMRGESSEPGDLPSDEEYKCRCHEVGGPFIDTDSHCPIHGTDAKDEMHEMKRLAGLK